MTGQEAEIIVTAAGLRMTEAAQIIQLSRSALYRWFSGEAKDDHRAYLLPIKTVKLIHLAVEKGLLPLIDVKGKQRVGMIRTVLKKLERDLTLGTNAY